MLFYELFYAFYICYFYFSQQCCNKIDISVAFIMKKTEA